MLQNLQQAAQEAAKATRRLGKASHLPQPQASNLQVCGDAIMGHGHQCTLDVFRDRLIISVLSCRTRKDSPRCRQCGKQQADAVEQCSPV